MAITITTVRPPASVTPLAWDWQAAQSADPYADQPIATLSADLKTGTVNAPGTTSNPPLYTVAGLFGLVAPGGSNQNGQLPLAGALLGADLASAGSGYVDGAYKDVPLVASTGTGTGATIDIQWQGGSIAYVVILESGSGYAVGDTLTVDSANVGGSGTGFALTVAWVY